MDASDFEDFVVQEKLRIGISVKDFKAIVAHADSLRASVKARFSYPTRPMQLSYEAEGMLCEFTLMTVGESRDASMTPAPAPASVTDRSRQSSVATREPSTRATSAREPSMPVQQAPERTNASQMAPPPPPASRGSLRGNTAQGQDRPSQRPPQPSQDPESLFIPVDDDDHQWDEPNYGDDDDVLGWDASADNVNQHPSNSVPAIF